MGLYRSAPAPEWVIKTEVPIEESDIHLPPKEIVLTESKKVKEEEEK